MASYVAFHLWSTGETSGGLLTYLCLYVEHAHKLEYKHLINFVLYVNFNHAWVEYYPITLITDVQIL